MGELFFMKQKTDSQKAHEANLRIWEDTIYYVTVLK